MRRRILSKQTMREPCTHWARSLSGVQIRNCSTSAEAPQRAAAVARASSVNVVPVDRWMPSTSGQSQLICVGVNCESLGAQVRNVGNRVRSRPPLLAEVVPASTSMG